MQLIIVSGTTSTGKSTLARRLAKDLDIQAFLRDDYKESRFDELDARPTLKQLSAIDDNSQQKLSVAITAAIEADTSLIIETNFTKSQAAVVKKLLQPNVQVIELFCYANGFRVLSRYIARNRTGERHAGHRDYLWYPIVTLEAFGLGRLRYRPLRLSSDTLLIDTNDFNKVSYQTILDFVRNAR